MQALQGMIKCCVLEENYNLVVVVDVGVSDLVKVPVAGWTTSF